MRLPPYLHVRPSGFFRYAVPHDLCVVVGKTEILTTPVEIEALIRMVLGN